MQQWTSNRVALYQPTRNINDKSANISCVEITAGDQPLAGIIAHF
jgi:hypothetical protein